MKLNNKGYMLVEVIVASAIALVMAYFLIDITITLVNKNNDYYVESTLITDKNLITKEIIDDVNNPEYSLIEISINIDGDVTTAELDYKNINDNSILERELIINKNTNEIKYGEYTKKLDDTLTIRDFKIEKDENQKQLYISIPAYTNYSDVDYGINLIIPYTNDIEVIIPEANFCNLTSGTPNSPDLVEGLIPVVYDESKNSWVKADSTNKNDSWYNYCEKKWANAVLVSDVTRNNYKNANTGATILDSDISAFYVWIPRYKYKVWNINKQAGVSSYDAYHTGIDIIFENEKETTGTISCTYNFNVDISNGGIDLDTTTAETCTGSNGDYYTHPAFTFGDDETRGFWMGKFELSGESAFNAENDNKIRIIPNVDSWRWCGLYSFYRGISNMQKENNYYGLSSDKSIVDSHVVKNMEWGAVLYLTNSIYGMCDNDDCTGVSKNGYGENTNYTTRTGCGPSSNGSYSEECNEYNTLIGMKASTTSNITGIYDMVGGSYEFVMGNMSMVKNGYVYNMSKSGLRLDDDIKEEDIQKYITTYAYDDLADYHYHYAYDGQRAYNRARLGDAVGETLLQISTKTDAVIPYNQNFWYGAHGEFTYNQSNLSVQYSWFIRSGVFTYTLNEHLFGFEYSNGAKSDKENKIPISSRAILVSLE